MATVGTIKDEMHVATCAQLLTLKTEADAMVQADPTQLAWFLRHIYREYNKKRFFECGGTSMITPYDGGFTPTSYSP